MSEAAAAPSAGISRRKLAIGAGVVGALGGLALGLWRARGDAESPEVAAFWAMNFQSPQGQALPMSAFKGKPLLLNFWATWCPPCIEEFPLLDAFYKQNQPNGWQVLGLAIDQPSAVRSFLGKQPVTFPIGLAGLEGTDLSRGLGNMAGGLPFTVVFGADGSARHRRMGRVSPDDLKAWAQIK
ncbi:TlpA family protein disulfide reductase [Ramlibacter albus]|uniref:TlpA family protein disulfide reductase n=1 Tax=Ramlibacter albus TaxID=2079448 RepID=A0A923M7Q2_9BURK|nr:TlpA disulfide reductase family protein [Ramlibacter albus]MBC5765525.1 TlpA family protein disulfide reductase [Ramlibacter albus]